MRSISADWFEIKVRYQKMMEDGLEKDVTETYVVDAKCFAEAEANITEEMEPYFRGDYTIKNISPASYREIFFSDFENDDKWYKAKLQFITIDEKTSKEKRTSQYFLVQGATLQGALKHIEDVQGAGLMDYVIASVAETQIMDVYEHLKTAAKKLEKDDKPEYEQAEEEKK